MRSEINRLETLDLLRGLTLVSMIFYHGMWDFLYLSRAGASMPGLLAWYEGTGGHLWQQSICRMFILLSGFCVPFSRRIFRRGLQVSVCGLAVSLVTVLFLYEDRVMFGVLTFLGAAMLLTGALQRLVPGEKEAPARGAALVCAVVCAVLFAMTRWVNRGFLRLLPGLRIQLPAVQCSFNEISGFILTGIGFPAKGFYSTDYFSLIPWIFLFWTGLFLHRYLAGRGAFSHRGFHYKLPVLNWMGKHSLLLYMLHQPVLYLLTAGLFSAFR